MHTNFKVFHSRHFVKINVVFKEVDGTESEKIRNIFGVSRFNKISSKREGDNLITSVVISTDKVISATEIFEVLKNNPNVITIARQDDDF